jgi:hypothetical protein
VVNEIVQVLRSALHTQDAPRKRLRLIHILVGDGIRSNNLAARMTLQYFRDHAVSLRLRYSLVVWMCASHQVNLVIKYAICGEDAHRADQVCGACSRFYKYLVPDYIVEFAFSLKKHVVDNLQIERDAPAQEVDAHRRRTELLQQLYGTRVIPDSLKSLFNLGLGSFRHCAADGDADATIKAGAYHTLYKLVLRIESKPVWSRMFLFADCVYGLLRIFLLKIPLDVFSTGVTQPRPENQKRLQRLWGFLNDEGMQAHLKKVTLCLQVSMVVTWPLCDVSCLASLHLITRLPSCLG